MTSTDNKESLTQQDISSIKGEAVSKTNSLITFECHKTEIPPSISYFEGRFYLSVVLWVNDQVCDLRVPISARDCAFLIKQGAHAQATFLAYHEAMRGIADQ